MPVPVLQYLIIFVAFCGTMYLVVLQMSKFILESIIRSKHRELDSLALVLESLIDSDECKGYIAKIGTKQTYWLAIDKGYGGLRFVNNECSELIYEIVDFINNLSIDNLSNVVDLKTRIKVEGNNSSGHH